MQRLFAAVAILTTLNLTSGNAQGKEAERYKVLWQITDHKGKKKLTMSTMNSCEFVFEGDAAEYPDYNFYGELWVQACSGSPEVHLSLKDDNNPNWAISKSTNTLPATLTIHHNGISFSATVINYDQFTVDE